MAMTTPKMRDMQEKRINAAYDVCASVALPCDVKRTRSQAGEYFDEICQKSHLKEYVETTTNRMFLKLTKSVAI
jgi:hypothetical protein